MIAKNDDAETEIEQSIYLIRGQKVLLDADIARLHQVTTKSLIQAVKRNKVRFPDDFMFQLSNQEYEGTYRPSTQDATLSF